MGLFENIRNKIKSIKGKKRKWTVEKKPRIERKTNCTKKKRKNKQTILPIDNIIYDLPDMFGRYICHLHCYIIQFLTTVYR